MTDLRLAVIPARGGSKRIPRKNILPFRGVPLLTRTVQMLLACGVFDLVVVSTDDEEIAAIGREAGATVPFMRPAELARDTTPTRPVLQHAITAVEEHVGRPVTTMCSVYPAAVFVTAADIVAAHDRLIDQDADFVFAAAPFPAPVQRAMRMDADGRPSMLDPAQSLTRSQDLAEAYHDAGQFYWGRRAAWFGAASVLDADSRLHVIPHWRVQDIDTPDDWIRAELLHQLIESA